MKYNVLMREHYNDDFDNWIGDYTDAENEESAVAIAKQWLIDHGFDGNVDSVECKCVQISTWSVELEANTWNDDTFTGTFDECLSYCMEHGYKIDGVETRIAEINMENGYCYQIVYNAVYCDAENCISCGNIECILHPGDGDD